ncbi:hypothetical protein DFH09DRAFT_1096699 [Mycena vulgaris]|nr:hypothetical protein DFH09DRAFT_1096699 [Mycena vulgaris]
MNASMHALIKSSAVGTGTRFGEEERADQSRRRCIARIRPDEELEGSRTLAEIRREKRPSSARDGIGTAPLAQGIFLAQSALASASSYNECARGCNLEQRLSSPALNTQQSECSSSLRVAAECPSPTHHVPQPRRDYERDERKKDVDARRRCERCVALALLRSRNPVALPTVMRVVAEAFIVDLRSRERSSREHGRRRRARAECREESVKEGQRGRSALVAAGWRRSSLTAQRTAKEEARRAANGNVGMLALALLFAAAYLAHVKGGREDRDRRLHPHVIVFACALRITARASCSCSRGIGRKYTYRTGSPSRSSSPSLRRERVRSLTIGEGDMRGRRRDPEKAERRRSGRACAGYSLASTRLAPRDS